MEKELKSATLEKFGGPNGNRTRVLALRGPRPRPLDDGTKWLGREDSNPYKQIQNLPSCPWTTPQMNRFYIIKQGIL